MLFATLLLATLLSLSAAQATGGAMTGGAMMGGTEGTVETADGASIYYQMQGEGDPMLLIHGYPLNSGLFRDNVGPLSEQYQVITVDLRGFGQSTSPSEEGSIETYATDVLAVMDELGIDQAIVGGMSMGGPIVFEMYRQAPERFSGMILNDTIDAAASPPEAGLWAGVAQQAEEMGVASLVDFLMPDMLTGETRMNQPELVEYLGSLMEEASQDAAIAGANALETRPDSSDTLVEITVPTLILTGVEDSLYAFEIAQMMNEGILNSELVLIPGAAHAAIIEAADEANAAILEWAAGLE
jgi:pimeloyl-ACP methyl ester carboxylesterase